jgi:hypothetical protein
MKTMKTISKTVLTLVFVALASITFAGGNLRLNVIELNENKALVSISSLPGTNFNLTVTDDKGQIVYYKENLKDSNYQQIYNFSDLEDGLYKMKVTSSDLSVTRFLEKKKQKIFISEERTTKKPFFGIKNNIFNCTYLNFDNENVTLRFYAKNEELFCKKIGNGFNIQQAFDLSKLEKGSYEAVLTAGDKQFSYDILIK